MAHLVHTVNPAHLGPVHMFEDTSSFLRDAVPSMVHNLRRTRHGCGERYGRCVEPACDKAFRLTGEPCPQCLRCGEEL